MRLGCYYGAFFSDYLRCLGLNCGNTPVVRSELSYSWAIKGTWLLLRRSGWFSFWIWICFIFDRVCLDDLS